MGIPFLQRQKTLEEEMEDNELLKVKYSNMELRAAIKKAKESGINNWQKTFGSLSSLIKWFRSH